MPHRGSPLLYAPPTLRHSEGERATARRPAGPDSQASSSAATFNRSRVLSRVYRCETHDHQGRITSLNSHRRFDAEIRDRVGSCPRPTATPRSPSRGSTTQREPQLVHPTVLLGTGRRSITHPRRRDATTTASIWSGELTRSGLHRDEYRVSASYLFSAFGGTHDLRAGASLSENREDLNRIANGWGTITNLNTPACGAAGQPCFRGIYWLDAPAQVSEAETWGIFLQDRITWDRLTLNIGVLATRRVHRTPASASTSCAATSPSPWPMRLSRPARRPLRTRPPAATGPTRPSTSRTRSSRASGSPTSSTRTSATRPTPTSAATRTWTTSPFPVPPRRSASFARRRSSTRRPGPSGPTRWRTTRPTSGSEASIPRDGRVRYRYALPSLADGRRDLGHVWKVGTDEDFPRFNRSF